MASIFMSALTQLNKGASSTTALALLTASVAILAAARQHTQKDNDSRVLCTMLALTPRAVAAESAKSTPSKPYNGSPLTNHHITPAQAVIIASQSHLPILPILGRRCSSRPTISKLPASCIPESINEWVAPPASCDNNATAHNPVRITHAHMYGRLVFLNNPRSSIPMAIVVKIAVIAAKKLGVNISEKCKSNTMAPCSSHAE